MPQRATAQELALLAQAQSAPLVCSQTPWKSSSTREAGRGFIKGAPEVSEGSMSVCILSTSPSPCGISAAGGIWAQHLLAQVGRVRWVRTACGSRDPELYPPSLTSSCMLCLILKNLLIVFADGMLLLGVCGQGHGILAFGQCLEIPFVITQSPLGEKAC